MKILKINKLLSSLDDSGENIEELKSAVINEPSNKEKDLEACRKISLI